MWRKAEELLNSDNAITSAPGKYKLAKMIISYSSPIPDIVMQGQRVNTDVILSYNMLTHLGSFSTKLI